MNKTNCSFSYNLFKKRVGYLSHFITYKYYCEAHDRYFIDSFDLKFHMNLNEGCRVKVIGK